MNVPEPTQPAEKRGQNSGVDLLAPLLSRSEGDQSILLLAPTANDARITAQVLKEKGLQAETCRDMPSLCARMEAGVGAILLAEESLDQESLTCLITDLAKMPPWSDVPVAIVTSGGEVSQTRLRRLRALDAGLNVMLLERPFRAETLVSTLEAALRSRQRQYQVRDLLAERKRAQDALQEAEIHLQAHALELERTVEERTAKLQETIGELEHFSYTITHDMRAPLRAIQGFGGLLLTEFGDRLAPEPAGYLRRMLEGTRRMDVLIRDALQYTKILTGGIELTLIEPAGLLRGVVDSYPNLQRPNAEIRIEEPMPMVLASEAGLLQCFSNLLSNAVKFVRPGTIPQIRVWAEDDGAFVRFWFEDNGIGIASAYHERIFGMFQQLDKSYDGTGIGLALVRKAIQRMGGAVGVESEIGQGSRFWLNCLRKNS